jgi:hypothetical protein
MTYKKRRLIIFESLDVKRIERLLRRGSSGVLAEENESLIEYLRVEIRR